MLKTNGTLIDLNLSDALAEALGHDALRAMIGSVCASLDMALADLEGAVASGQTAKVAAIAHAVRGRVAMVGCCVLADTLADVERAVSVGTEMPEISRKVGELRPIAQATVSELSACVARPVERA